MKSALLVIGFAALIVLLSDFLPVSNAQTSAPLFTLTETPQAKAKKSSPAAVRESEINVNAQNLRGGAAETLSFPLFDGKTYEAKRVENEIRAMNDFTWRGKITEEKFAGDVILTYKNGFAAGLIYAADSVYEIVPNGDRLILVELNQAAFPECGGGIKSDETNQPQKSIARLSSVDSGDRIDVLVLYTSPVKTTLGGDAQARVFAQQAVDAANTAYLNSKIRQRLRLVSAQETAVEETGTLGSELIAVRTNAAVQTLREEYKADLVALISNSNDNCGIGYLMGSGSPSYAFSVTSRNCAVGNLSFAHELGHNMGSQHNPEDGGSGATHSYGYGHYVNGVFRTVMSYVNQCQSGCPRRPFFSNPEITFSGFSTGLSNARDNARAINNTSDIIANYRYSGANLMMNNFNENESLPRNITRTLRWSSENVGGNVKIEISRDSGATWKTLAASTPNDDAENITVSGAPTKRARLRIVSVDNPAISDSSVKNISIR
jgi:hypothetical protein